MTGGDATTACWPPSPSTSTAPTAGIEHVTLTGTGALNATGNDGANMLIGNGGANKLDGKAGATPWSAAPAPTPTRWTALDVVIENAGEGIDQVNSSADFILGPSSST